MLLEHKGWAFKALSERSFKKSTRFNFVFIKSLEYSNNVTNMLDKHRLKLEL